MLLRCMLLCVLVSSSAAESSVVCDESDHFGEGNDGFCCGNVCYAERFYDENGSLNRTTYGCADGAMFAHLAGTCIPGDGGVSTCFCNDEDFCSSGNLTQPIFDNVQCGTSNETCQSCFITMMDGTDSKTEFATRSEQCEPRWERLLQQMNACFVVQYDHIYPQHFCNFLLLRSGSLHAEAEDQGTQGDFCYLVMKDGNHTEFGCLSADSSKTNASIKGGYNYYKGYDFFICESNFCNRDEVTVKKATGWREINETCGAPKYKPPRKEHKKTVTCHDSEQGTCCGDVCYATRILDQDNDIVDWKLVNTKKTCISGCADGEAFKSLAPNCYPDNGTNTCFCDSKLCNVNVTLPDRILSVHCGELNETCQSCILSLASGWRGISTEQSEMCLTRAENPILQVVQKDGCFLDQSNSLNSSVICSCGKEDHCAQKLFRSHQPIFSKKVTCHTVASLLEERGNSTKNPRCTGDYCYIVLDNGNMTQKGCLSEGSRGLIKPGYSRWGDSEFFVCEAELCNRNIRAAKLAMGFESKPPCGSPAYHRRTAQEQKLAVFAKKTDKIIMSVQNKLRRIQKESKALIKSLKDSNNAEGEDLITSSGETDD